MNDAPPVLPVEPPRIPAPAPLDAEYASVDDHSECVICTVVTGVSFRTWDGVGCATECGFVRRVCPFLVHGSVLVSLTAE